MTGGEGHSEKHACDCYRYPAARLAAMAHLESNRVVADEVLRLAVDLADCPEALGQKVAVLERRWPFHWGRKGFCFVLKRGVGLGEGEL